MSTQINGLNHFDPERCDANTVVNNAESFLGFGVGPRICLGKQLGLMDAKMGLISILKDYKVALADTTNLEIDSEIDSDGELLYPKHGMKLKLIPR